MLIKIRENDAGTVFHSDFVPNSLFNFYVLRRRLFVDGTSNWNICCELSTDDTRYFVIDSIRGTREDAIRRFEDILKQEKERA